MIHHRDTENTEGFSPTDREIPIGGSRDLPFGPRRDLLSDWCEAWWEGRSLQMKQGNQNTLFAFFATLR